MNQYAKFLEPQTSSVSYAIDLMASRMRYTTVRLLDQCDPAQDIPHQFSLDGTLLNFMAVTLIHELTNEVWNLT